MMDKFGTCNTQERIALMERYDRLFGMDSIDFLVADREFIGHEWLSYLNRNRIVYHIRIRENVDVVLAKWSRLDGCSADFNSINLKNIIPE